MGSRFSGAAAASGATRTRSASFSREMASSIERRTSAAAAASDGRKAVTSWSTQAPPACSSSDQIWIAAPRRLK